MGHYHQGKYILKNPDKYIGNSKEITYRSSWEKKLMIMLDTHSRFIKWNSEGKAIPYFSKIDNKIRRYFPDIWVQYKDKNGNTVNDCIEVKPFKETQPPKKSGGKNSKKRYLKECLTYQKNQDKWNACNTWCKKNGWNFRLMTENELYA